MKTLWVLFVVLGAAVSLAQDQAVASLGLNVRKGRTTAAAIVGHISAGDTVALIAKKPTQGYFHVRTPGVVAGWAWAARLSVVTSGGGVASPRVRAHHPNWKVGDLQTATQNGDSERVSGWVMFDPLHYNQMWQYHSPADTSGTRPRITLWEIHPITRIEVFLRHGPWVSLDKT